MVINSFTILDNDMNSIGTGVYLACSILDHSCNPNAVATFDGKTISIRATKDISYLDWDQVGFLCNIFSNPIFNSLKQNV